MIGFIPNSGPTQQEESYWSGSRVSGSFISSMESCSSLQPSIFSPRRVDVSWNSVGGRRLIFALAIFVSFLVALRFRSGFRHKMKIFRSLVCVVADIPRGEGVDCFGYLRALNLTSC